MSDILRKRIEAEKIPGRAERLLDFAMIDICCFALTRASKSRSPIVRVVWMAINFPWIVISAPVALALELIAAVSLMFRVPRGTGKMDCE